MKVKVRTVNNVTFEVEVPEDATVRTLKEQIVATQGEPYTVETQKLIMKGSVLANETAIKDLGLTPESFFVVFVSKAVAPKAPKPAEKAPEAETQNKPAQAAPAEAAPAQTPQPAAPSQPAAAAAPAAQAVDPEMESKIASIAEMGFERQDIVRALRAAFNNADRAVEYLMTGIPEGLEQDLQGRPAQAQAQGGGEEEAEEEGEDGGDGDEPLDIFGGRQQGQGPEGANTGIQALERLRNHPQLAMLRNLMAANPQLLPQVLTTMAQSDPELVQGIMQNQEAFMQIMQGGAAAQGGDDEGGDEGVARIELTQEEMEAVQRLEALGFDRNLCLEAYLICDKNEELAANYLLENAMQD